MRLYYKSYQNKCIKLFFCQRVIGSFYCDEIGDSFYMRLDHSNLCYDGTWLFYLPINITLIVLWVFGKCQIIDMMSSVLVLTLIRLTPGVCGVDVDSSGVPLLFWVILFRKRSRGVSDMLLLIQDPSQDQLKESLLLKMRLDIIDRGQVLDEEKLQIFEEDLLVQYLRDRNLNEPSTVAQVGFIYHSYNTSFWWFEVWDLGRKLLLNCVVSLLAKAGANRICCGLVVLLVYLSVMLFYKPYRERSDSALAGVTHIQLFITLFCGLILKMGSLYLEESVVWLVTYTAIVTSLGTLIYAAFSILNEKVTGVKMAKRRCREGHRRAIAAQVRKLWRKAFGYALAEVYLRNSDAGLMSLLVMIELARRGKWQREMELLNAQVELTSAVNPMETAEEPDSIVSASQIAVIEDDPATPDKIDATEESVRDQESGQTG
ncbi:hypothetical protein BBJ29_002444 [Phytophthora kernoviae]|uniref:TRP C-terminal domain-containing protein n=1 Tax=Phytophthora kernoviae TaxID=325452 RepID=A0A3F2RPY2_9STRA|nr:hypothetical protein BBJ29_002444 [Phytophthora kernoviae]RLN61561.1 hypothetical protein BBP00_00005315 [Phytophthora kernoviae]